MERHPVPQNIMDVEFKLFGYFTIRQFGYMAGGFVVGLLIYFSGVPLILRLVLTGFSVVMGLFLGLVRINGQPSTTWMSNFILALFTSQQRVWKKGVVTPEILKDAATNPIQKQDVDLVKTLSRPQRRLPQIPLDVIAPEANSVAEQDESTRLKQIEQHFDFTVKILDPRTEQVQKQTRDVAPPNLNQTIPQPADTQKTAQVSPVVTMDPRKQALAGKIDEIVNGEPIAKTESYAAVYKPMGTATVNRPISSPERKKIGTDLLDELMSGAPIVDQAVSESAKSDEQPSQMQSEQVVEEQVNEQLPTVHKPNIISGIVTDKKGNPISNAELEIKDPKEHMVRKIHTGQHGLFAMTNPLPDGDYFIDITAAGFKFNRFELILSGKPLPNYKFSAK